jgi:hypothetical protein
MSQADRKNSQRELMLRGVAFRSGFVVAALVFAAFFFSDDPTLIGLSGEIRLGLTVFFLAVTSGLGWLFLRRAKLR